MHLTTGFWFKQPVPPIVNHTRTTKHETITTHSIYYEPPPSLTHLTTSWHFNQPIDNLPSTLTHLTLGKLLNQPIDKLPPTLTHLEKNSINQLIIFHPHSQLKVVSINVDKLPLTLTHHNWRNNWRKIQLTS
jgi:FNIP Repeat